MLYQEYIEQVMLDCVLVDEIGRWFLRPDYRYQLATHQQKLGDVTDFGGVTIQIVAQQLHMQVDFHNHQFNHVEDIANYLYKIFNNTLQPAAQEQATKLFNDVVQYLKLQDKKTKEKNPLLETVGNLNVSKKITTTPKQTK